MGFAAAFEALAARITWVGSSALPATNTSTGTRKSLDPSAADRGVNEVDQWTRSGIPMISSLAAATLIGDSDVNNWTKASVTVGGTQAVRKLDFASGGSKAYVREVDTLTATAATFTIKIRKLSGDLANYEMAMIENGGSYTKFASCSLSAVTSDFITVSCTGVSPGTSVRIEIRQKNIGDPAASIEVSNVRAVNSTAPAAPFPDGSAAGASVGVDRVSAPISWPTEGTIISLPIAYGWGGVDNPVSTSPRLWDADNGDFLIADGVTDSNGYLAIWDASSKKVASTVALTANKLAVVFSDYSATEIGLTVNDGARATSASTLGPAGDLEIGNNPAANRNFHGALVTGVVDWVLSAAERQILYTGLMNIFDPQVLQ